MQKAISAADALTEEKFKPKFMVDLYFNWCNNSSLGSEYAGLFSNDKLSKQLIETGETVEKKYGECLK